MYPSLLWPQFCVPARTQNKGFLSSSVGCRNHLKTYLLVIWSYLSTHFLLFLPWDRYPANVERMYCRWNSEGCIREIYSANSYVVYNSTPHSISHQVFKQLFAHLLLICWTILEQNSNRENVNVIMKYDVISTICLNREYFCLNLK